MAILNTVALAIIAISISAFSLSLFWLIGKSVHQGDEVRQQLTDQMSKLPLSRLLAKLGFNQSHFVHQVATINIQRGVKRCENCAQLEQCSECLMQSEVTVDQVTFCPNHDCLKDFAQTLETTDIEPEAVPAT